MLQFFETKIKNLLDTSSLLDSCKKIFMTIKHSSSARQQIKKSVGHIKSFGLMPNLFRTLKAQRQSSSLGQKIKICWTHQKVEKFFPLSDRLSFRLLCLPATLPFPPLCLFRHSAFSATLPFPPLCLFRHCLFRQLNSHTPSLMSS